MKLYYAPGACSLSPHIVMREAGIPVQLVKVDTAAKKTEDGTDFRTINSKGYVPTLELPDGQRLTEGSAIVQYLADARTGARLRNDRALSAAGVAQLHLDRTAQAVQPAVRSGLREHAQGTADREDRGPFRLGHQAAGRPRSPDGQRVHGRRRLLLHDADLVPARGHRSIQMAGAHRLQGPRRATAAGARGAESRGIGEGLMRLPTLFVSHGSPMDGRVHHPAVRRARVEDRSD